MKPDRTGITSDRIQETRKAWIPSRRQVVGAGGATAAMFVAGCDLSSEPEEAGGQGNQDSETDAKEAPEFAEQVSAGDLPPLEERLPKNPIVVEPHERVGQYGGTWTNFGDSPPVGGGHEVHTEWLVQWKEDWSDYVPNLAESWDIEDDGRAWTFHLREGVKWSDGTPFTAEDIDFAYNDVLNNEELFTLPPGHFITGGEPGELEVLDDYTIRFTFARPNGLFLEYLASAGPHVIETCPKHYFSQFHPEYNQDLDQLLQDEGFDTWTELWTSKGGPQGWTGDIWYPEVPILAPWRVTERTQQGSRLIMERNPYYWKTDPDGRQLPYLDQYVVELVTEQEAALLKATNGEFDFLHPTFFNPNLGTPRNKPVLAQSREQGNYDFVDGLSSTMCQFVISLNLTHNDQAKREVFQNKNFRIGLSYAINREEIINAVYQQQGEPWQAAPREESDIYHEELAKQYVEYDVDRANEHLDQAGYTERDNAGFRLRPDGRRISFKMDVITEEPTQIDALELIKDYWQEVGVEMNLDTIDRDLFYTRKEANEHDANVWTGDGGLRDAYIDARFYLPAWSESNFALAWATWYTSDGESGEEPPEPARRQMELYDQIEETVDVGERRELMMQILDIAVDQFWAIGTVLTVGTYGIKRNDLHNVPPSMIASWRYPTPGPSHPEQYFSTA